MSNFGPKPWTDPFGKISILRPFELLVFVAQKGVLFFLQYLTTHCPGLYCLRIKRWKNGQLWTNPFAKISILQLLELLVIIASKGYKPWNILPKIKKMEKRTILDKNHGLTPFQNSFMRYVRLHITRVIDVCGVSL